MQYHDQHLHTYFSFDSTEAFENYLTIERPFFVTTDHFDLANPAENFKDSIPDFKEYTKKLQQLSQNYSTHFLKGIELGIVASQIDKITAFLADKDYDLKLISIHQNGRYDYMDDWVLSQDKMNIATNYFDNMEHVLTHFHEGDVLTHFDYGLRRFSFTPRELATHFEGQLTRILKQVIQKEMALELNAKSFKTYGNALLYDYVIDLYLSLGGTFFTLGSDAHRAEDYELAFPEMKHVLKEKGVTELTLFLPDGRQQVPLMA